MDELLVLKNAIQKGDLSETKTLILSRVSLSRRDISEAFLEAIKGNKAEIFEYFINEFNGLNFRYADAKGRQALHYAVDIGNGKMVKELIRHGAIVCYNDNEGYQVVHIATENGDVDMLTFLVNHGADISRAKTVKDGYTPVHIAVLSNQAQALKVLVVLTEHSGSVNIQTRRNNNCLTPLHLAAKAGYEEIVEILCAMNACLDLADIEGKVPLHYAADRGYLKVMKILRTYGASLTIKDCNRRSLLNYAVRSKSVDCIQFLIDNGAEVNEPDLSGHTPLIVAVVVESVDNMGILLKHGADINVRGPGQETPLLLAASAGNFDVIKNLIDAGADVSAVNRLKETVLHKCQKISYDKRDAVLELLLRAGAELNVIDSSGFTPIHNCAFQTKFNNFTLSTLKILVEAGASMTQTERMVRISRKVIRYYSFICGLVLCFFWVILVFYSKFDDSNDEKNDLSTTMTDVSTAMERRIKTLQKNCKLIRNNLNSKSISGFKILEVLKVDQYRFCKVPKCGCTYWLQVFLVMKKTIKPEVLSNLDREELHFRLQDSIISYDYIPEVTDLMIMITRDPWKRLYSAYIDKIYRGQSNFVPLYKEMTSDSGTSECYTIPTFQEFLDYIVRISAEGRELDMHWQPVSDMCKVCSNKYRYIVKQEAFVKESAYILENILQQSPDIKDALILLLTEKFAENSLLQLGRQFVSEMSASHCQNFKDKIKRLWVSFQSQGFISNKIKFDIGLFENLSEQNGTEILNIFMTRGTSLELSNKERTLQRHKHLVNAYKNISRKTLVNIQDVYHNDFLLFGYKKTPPS